MPNPDEAGRSDSGDAPAPADSPKPHSEKLAGAVRAAAGEVRPGEEVGSSGGALPSGDSPKPHGDKLATAVRGRGAAPPAEQGGDPDRGNR